VEGVQVRRAKTVYDDPEAEKYVWGMGFHWYTGDHFDNVRQVADAYPDKKLLFTEGCVYPFNLDSINEWHWGETYGKSIIMDLNNGASGWVDWNIILDETGGPNHVNNYCFAPVIANTKTGEVHYMNSFYFLGHFSKFIRPRAKRIACTSNEDALIATSFKNEDKSVVTVVQNLSSVSEKTDIWVNGKSVSVEIPAHLIISVVLK
jgi:glucosylceramidase